ncbi:Aspartic protease [Phytophthora megakarya]|uniref:Aspartic protease n=1 Tax=Phytophthora megakarya TaxID=4795 RepID=A0A225URH4_9STRA|nr:Aspartic protease [Phytophthora megakarya]
MRRMSHGVYGAVNDEQTKISLDSWSSRSMISLDLARRLKLKVQMLADPVKVSGLGGAQSYIIAMVKVKIRRTESGASESGRASVPGLNFLSPTERTCDSPGDIWLDESPTGSCLGRPGILLDNAVKVVNISQSRLWLRTGTVVAKMVDYDYFSQAWRFGQGGNATMDSNS